jgi:hypothetical protein
MTQLLTTDTKGLNLTIEEIVSATNAIIPSAGPFQVDVTDPAADATGQNGAITVTPGSKDQTTPTNFKPSGNGKTATITIKVTDVSNSLTDSITFDVVAPSPPPPPPPKADKMIIGLVPAP